jgi:hypothetical protein
MSSTDIGGNLGSTWKMGDGSLGKCQGDCCCCCCCCLSSSLETCATKILVMSKQNMRISIIPDELTDESEWLRERWCQVFFVSSIANLWFMNTVIAKHTMHNNYLQANCFNSYYCLFVYRRFKKLSLLGFMEEWYQAPVVLRNRKLIRMTVKRPYYDVNLYVRTVRIRNVKVGCLCHLYLCHPLLATTPTAACVTPRHKRVTQVSSNDTKYEAWIYVVRKGVCFLTVNRTGDGPQNETPSSTAACVTKPKYTSSRWHKQPTFTLWGWKLQFCK